MPPPSNNPSSFLVAEEYFATSDDRFVEAIRAVGDPKRLAAFAERWKTDPRPWAREQVLRYLEMPLDAPGHQPVVKRLFKEAEQRGDDELVGAFLVAFDTLVRRRRRVRWKWNYDTRAAEEVEELVTPRDVMPRKATVKGQNPKTLEKIYYVPRKGPGAKLFTYRTRYYLRRRAWRYFRVMGRTKVEGGVRFVKGVGGLLARYEDEDLKTGENILDSWALLQIGFRGSAAIAFTPHHVKLVEGHGLGELAAAARFEGLWKLPAGGEALLGLLGKGKSRLVRVWARQMLEKEEAFLRGLSPAQLMPLLESGDEEVQQFAAGALKHLGGLQKLALADWLKMLETKNGLALEMLVEVLKEKVAPERFSLEQLVELATRVPAAVAKVGLEFLKGRRFGTAGELDAVARLSGAQSPAVGGEIARFGLGIVAAAGVYQVDRVSAFFDALLREVRVAAWEAMVPESPMWNDAALWGRLMESPYDDVRLKLVEILEKRQGGGGGVPGATAEGLANVWTAVLLGVHRGGRQKIKALGQISRELLVHVDRAEKLLPIVAVAIRSVRPAEARVGLAALVTVMERRPELGAVVERMLPEMKLLPTLEASA